MVSTLYQYCNSCKSNRRFYRFTGVSNCTACKAGIKNKIYYESNYGTSTQREGSHPGVLDVVNGLDEVDGNRIESVSRISLGTSEDVSIKRTRAGIRKSHLQQRNQEQYQGEVVERQTDISSTLQQHNEVTEGQGSDSRIRRLWIGLLPRRKNTSGFGSDV